jgi:hypothetical protein
VARGLIGPIASVDLLGHDGALEWVHGDDGLIVTLPPRPVGPYALTFKIRPASI